MFQEEVMVPVGDWSKRRLKNLSEADYSRDESKTSSGFGKKIVNWVGRDKVYPTNVLHMATECAYKGHSATFPVDLPSWYIKLFTKKDDVVLDPFMGSGTTALASKQLGRHFVGIDMSEDYCKIAKERVTLESQSSLDVAL
jgi:DNA modification methylase